MQYLTILQSKSVWRYRELQKRRMEPIEVSISKGGHIRLAQDESVIARDGEQIIIIHPAQLDTVIQWMQEVKEEISNNDYEDLEEE